MENIKVGIYGLGLLGGSLAMALKKFLPTSHIYGYGRNKEKLKDALERGIIDLYGDENSEELKELDFFIIGTPVGMIAKIFSSYMEMLSDKVIVMDVGSVKREVINSVSIVNSKRLKFVGTHPMAGGEKSGIEYAKAELFVNKTVAIIEDGCEDKEVLFRASDFWKTLGAITIFLSAELHDRIVAATSHLPHLVSSLLCNLLSNHQLAENCFFNLYGNGLLDTTRIAQGDPEMWTDIILYNKDNLNELLGEMSDELLKVKNILENSDKEKLLHFLRKGKIFREKI
ncbi:MAG: prephenate dehydrogenase/arogenate dehydrogenase family protein [Chitinispirillaceae bacterium]|nr:prephenate dehydrogenase/arogenate dehydrogenase family protein [Chitinispirillaceae bacterium]